MRYMLLCVCFIFHVSSLAQTSSKDEQAEAPSPISINDLIVRGLLKNMVVIEVRGKQHTLFAGKSSPEGFMLISSSTKGAVVEFEGQRHTLGLSRQVGGAVYTAPAKSEVRVPRGVGGHYFTPGRINNRPVNFLVDTGATAVVINALYAKRLQINYKKGIAVTMQTANGVSKGYRVTLKSVSVGSVKVNNVDAVVSEGAYPAEILLGNTYLTRVQMKVDRGVLVLQAQY